MTRRDGGVWLRLPESERLLLRTVELKDEIQRKQKYWKSHWSHVDVSIGRLFDDAEVKRIVRSTLHEERLIGKSMDEALEALLAVAKNRARG